MPPPASTHAPEPAPSDEDAPILALERFAALSADIEAGSARDEVIAREGLTVEAWTRAQESWLGKMAEEAARKRFELTNRYNTAFVAQRRSHDGGGRRASTKKKKGARADVANVAPVAPPLAAAPPLVSSPPPSSAPAFVSSPPVTSAPAFVAPAPVPAPSFVEPPPRVSAPSFVEPPPRVSAPPLVAAPAHVASSPSTVAVPVYVEPPAEPASQRLGETAAVRRSPFAQDAALPFVKSALPFEAPASQRSSALPPATPFERSSAHPAPATPFERPSAHPAPATAFERPSAHPASATPKFDPNAVMDLGGTVSAELLSPIELNSSLPFRGASASARPPPPAPPPPPGASLQNLPFRAAGPAAKAPAAPAAPSAPAAPAAPRAVRFTLEQFTSLSAEIAVAPASVAQVRGRYGLDEASHRAEAEEWGRRFAADKELFARYSALFQSYRDWLARSTR